MKNTRFALTLVLLLALSAALAGEQTAVPDGVNAAPREGDSVPAATTASPAAKQPESPPAPSPLVEVCKGLDVTVTLSNCTEWVVPTQPYMDPMVLVAPGTAMFYRVNTADTYIVWGSSEDVLINHK